MTSRTAVADYVAGQLETDRAGAIRTAAAWLVARGRGRQAAYLANDVAVALAARGYHFVRIASAHELSAEVRAQVEDYLTATLKATTLEVEYETDTALIGGIRIDTPTATLDASVDRRLTTLVERMK